MDALLLAAGFGTRLHPLTKQVPKPLLPIYGVPLLNVHVANLLAHKGPDPISRVTVNGHHLAGQVRDHIDAHFSSDRVYFSHEPEILGTGGAMAHAARYLASDPFLVLNCDALIVPPIAEAVSFHKASNHAATMILIRSEVWPNVRTEGGRVAAILRGKRDPNALTFTGCHVVSRELLDLLPGGVFHDIRDTYENLIRRKKLGAFIWEAEAKLPFLDVGTAEAYLEAHRICSGAGCCRFGFSPAESKIRFVDGFGCADRSAVLGENCRIEDSIVLEGARIAPGARILHSIIGPGAPARGEVSDRLVTTAGKRKIAS